MSHISSHTGTKKTTGLPANDTALHCGPEQKSRYRMSATLALCAALISACGGGGSTDSELAAAADADTSAESSVPIVSEPPSDQEREAPPTEATLPVLPATSVDPVLVAEAPVAEAAPAPSETASAVATEWVVCASEGQTCSFSGTRPVRYGTTSRYFTKTFSNGVACTNGNFGDPVVGTKKTCWLGSEPAAAAAVASPATGNGGYALPALPAPPSGAVDVTKLCNAGQCARPDDNQDDSAAIQYALDKAKSGQWLVFPPGRYLIDKSLMVRVAGLTLWGKGATVHATNPNSQSIIIEADNTSVYSFKLTAVTQGRGKTHQHTRIAVYGGKVVTNTVIRGNQIVPAGEPGTSLAHGGSASGIFLSAAHGFLVAENTVERTLADAIHITGGSRNGRVIGNKVRENGDDMIAMVSYAYTRSITSASQMQDSLEALAEKNQVRNIVVAHNDLAGQYWGRGLTVVGGRDITIHDNKISNTAHGAGILVVREKSYGTFGVKNVLVTNNRIEQVQTGTPPYDYNGKFASGGRTGHGAIEVHASLRSDEAALPRLVESFSVKDVLIRGNQITSSATPGVRVGATEGRLGGIYIDNNTLRDIKPSDAIRIYDGAKGSAECSANSDDGSALSARNCGGRSAPVSINGAGS